MVSGKPDYRIDPCRDPRRNDSVIPTSQLKREYTKNDIMLYSVVQAESHDAAAKSFEGHPHLQIPQSSIEVMEIHSLQGMA
jgi:hypothetical protein